MNGLRKIFIFISIIMAMSVSVYANDNDVADLTVDEAVQKAIEYSSMLRSIDDNLVMADQEQDDLVIEYTHTNTGYNAYSLSAKIRSIRNQILNYELSAEVEKLSIEISVKQFFADVIEAEKQLELFDDELAIEEKELTIAKVKNEIGLLSDVDYSENVKEHDKTLAQRVDKENSIVTAYRSLNTVLGVLNLNTRYNLVMESEYVPYAGGDVQNTINKAMSVSQSVTTAERSLELAKYDLEAYSSLTSDKTIESVQASVRQEADSYAETKKSVESEVISLYNQIMQNETDYELNKKELVALEKQLEIARVKLEMGEATALEVENIEYSIKSMEATIDSLVREHDILLQKYNNPKLF